MEEAAPDDDEDMPLTSLQVLPKLVGRAAEVLVKSNWLVFAPAPFPFSVVKASQPFFATG
eukprot:3495472-Amphidinium_carterae.1